MLSPKLLRLLRVYSRWKRPPEPFVALAKPSNYFLRTADSRLYRSGDHKNRSRRSSPEVTQFLISLKPGCQLLRQDSEIVTGIDRAMIAGHEIDNQIRENSLPTQLRAASEATASGERATRSSIKS
jgi:hypothetical protein